jgi:L-seryl-tRNA(Ser) seleniumtransferase
MPGEGPPIIARIEDERLLLDPRTVLPEQDGVLIDGVRAALRGIRGSRGRTRF